MEKFVTFNDMLGALSKRYGGKTAFVYVDEDGILQRMSYLKFASLVNAKAAEFRLQSFSSVGVYQAPSIGWIVNTLASVIAGKRTVLLDAMLDEKSLQSLVSYARVEYLSTDAFTSSAAEHVKMYSAPDAQDSDVKFSDGSEGDVLFFTSGTTEMSKAVVLTSQSLLASAWTGGESLPISDADNMLCMLPLTHVFGFVCSLLWPLTSGATISLSRGMRHLADDCAYFEPTYLSAVPSILYFLLAHSSLNQGLKVVLVGAGPVGADALTAVKAKGIRVSFGYGLTETSSGVAISTGDDPFKMDVCKGVSVTLDADGEILLSCPDTMMKGYYLRDEDTAKVLQDGVLRTGDIGRFEDDKLIIVGRKKDILVLANGNKIYLPEWEAELLSVLGAKEVALTMRGDKVVALVVPTAEQTAEATNVIGDAKGAEGANVANAATINRVPVTNEANTAEGANEANTADGATDLQSAFEKLLLSFNATKPFDKRVSGVELHFTPLPRTATGKLKRWMF